MARPFPGKSSLPPLIDFGDDSDEFSVPPRAVSSDGLTNSGGRFVVVDPFDFGSSNHSTSLDGHRSECLDSTSCRNEANPLGSSQCSHSTLDHLFSGPYPPVPPPSFRSFKNEDSSLYYEAENHIPSLPKQTNARSTLDKPTSLPSDHHHHRISYNSFPDLARTSDQEIINQSSSFSSISSHSDSGGSPDRCFVAASASFAQETGREENCKERNELNDGGEVSSSPFVPNHRKTPWEQHFDTVSQSQSRNAWRTHSRDECNPRNAGHFQTSEQQWEETYALNGERRRYEKPFGEKSDDEDPNPCSLPEFVGGGGGTGIFKVPLRAAVHPRRPPSFELRPHPLRETQIGCFLRNITHIQGQLWAGQESGVRFWNLSDVFMKEKSGVVMMGDEETVPFCHSVGTSATLCLIADLANRLIWTGHKDGKIRSWKMDSQNSDDMPFKEFITWQAHRNPVLSLAISSYSDLWSGSEGGCVKVWPWEAIAKVLDTLEEEKQFATTELERSYINLRNQATVDGVCYLPADDVRFMLADTCRAKVWGGGHLQIALWDAGTRDLLKVFGLDGQGDILPDFNGAKEVAVHEEMKTKFVMAFKKEKSQASLSFFQRSRNALMGAADAVRRAAAKAPFGDDTRRTEAIVMSPDGLIWTGCANGLVVQWDGNANRLQEFHHHSFAVQSIYAAGTRIWVGYASGIVQVMNLEGKLLGEWVAHGSPVTRITVGEGYVFTMANHGGVRAWNMASPNPIDNTLKSELCKKEFLYCKQQKLRILAGTWNVGQERASYESLVSWMVSAASNVGIVIVGLQEIEMGAGFLAMAAAKESVGLEGSANGQWWLDAIGKVLEEGTSFHRVGSRQLAGLIIAVWVRKDLRPYVGDVDAAAVPCGFGHAFGNKGAVGLKMRVYDRTMCFVNCHFAAHLEAVNKRNADFNHVYRTMAFNKPKAGVDAVAAGVSSVHLIRGVNVMGYQNEDSKPDLAEADMLIFLGDFNYRLHDISYDEARDFVSQRSFDWLQEKDQLRAEMRAGRVFQGLREAVLKFPPTYKFERHQAGLQGYDSGEKKRIPAWCDRILFRDNRSSLTSLCSLECPVVSHVTRYEACMDVTDSDHKPVRCIFNLNIAHVDEWMRRVEFGNIMSSNAQILSMLKDLNKIPETVVSTNNIILQDQDTSILRITNRCVKNKATYKIICKEPSVINDDRRCTRCDYGFPRWLEVNPAVGVLRPGQVTEVSIQHEEIHSQEELVGVPQNWWSEDTRDHDVILEIIVGGHCSTGTRSHQIHVQHCFTSKAMGSDSEGSSRTGRHRKHLQRSEHQNMSNPSEFAYDFRSWQYP